jgi:hypothetical protein
MADFQMPYAGLYFSTPAGTSCLDGVPIKAAGTTTATQISTEFSHSDNRLTYTGSGTRIFLVTCTVSMSATSAADSEIYIAKNGVEIADTQILRKISTASDDGALATSILVTMTNTDYVELWLECTGSDETLTVSAGGYSVTLAG